MTIDLSRLPIGAKLVTRDGRHARLIAKDLRAPRPYVVAITSGDGREFVDDFSQAGEWAGRSASAHDIVGVAA